ncbi:MAG: DUF2779 domain-containing protein [Bacilli bacterium]|nr:DUF2779 domain-containing protein [Bacilli bacterium]
MIDDTKKALEKDNIVICEASFLYKNNFCSVDILEKKGKDLYLYEVKGSTSMKDVFLHDMSFQYYVLTSLGYNIKKYYLVYLNNKYYRQGKLNLNKLFTKVDVTDKIIELQDHVISKLKEINNYMQEKKVPGDDIDLKCFKPYACPYWKYCTRNLPKPNVFDIYKLNKQKMIGYYKENIITFKDLEKVNLNSNQMMQIEYELNDKDDYINKDNIRKFLNTLTYPLYFLDFETFQLPIPKYDNTCAYQKIPFQYSLHYIEKGKLYHKEFLGSKKDPRRELAERLISDIPENVCVLAYNMGFEKGVIKNLAYLFPDLKEHLLNIYDNIKDLMIPFQKKDYYNKLMKGSYSIKYVLPALFPNEKELDYHNLELVHNGSEAMSYYDTLFDKPISEQEYIRKCLLEYCKLDTYAMVMIYEKLLEVTNNKIKIKKIK